MEYTALTPDDLDNVRALNAAWLKSGLAGAGRLSSRAIGRLAATPFLLFTLHEDDDERWQRLLDRPPQRDLLQDSGSAPGERRSLQAAALAFLWELARRNPYAARLVSQASTRWCLLVTPVTLMRLLACAADCDLIAARFSPDSAVFRRLLSRGGSGLHDVREAAQLSALQTLLTVRHPGRDEQPRAAACRARSPVREVVDEV